MRTNSFVIAGDLNSDPFDGNTDIACPPNLVDPGIDCNASTDPADTGEPIITRDDCDVLGQTDPIDVIIPPANNSTDDFLFKIERTWTIFDWCDLDDAGLPAEYNCVQFIKVFEDPAGCIDNGNDDPNQVGCDILVIEVDDLLVVDVGFTGIASLNADDPGLYAGDVPNNPKVSLTGDGGSFVDALPFTCADLDNGDANTLTVFLEFDDGIGGRVQCTTDVIIDDFGIKTDSEVKKTIFFF